MAIYKMVGDKEKLTPVDPTSFGEEGVLEREDLQRMLRDQPEVLIEKLLVGSFEATVSVRHMSLSKIKDTELEPFFTVIRSAYQKASSHPIEAASPDAGPGDIRHQSRLSETTRPFLITNCSWRRLLMSSSGLAATAMRSASLPASTVPS